MGCQGMGRECNDSLQSDILNWAAKMATGLRDGVCVVA